MRCRVAIVVGAGTVAGIGMMTLVPPVCEAVEGFFVAACAGRKRGMVKNKVEGGRVVVVVVSAVAVSVVAVPSVAGVTTPVGGSASIG